MTYSLKAPLDDSLRPYGNDAEKHLHADAEGLRFTIPIDREHYDAIGIEAPVRLGGDFEVTLTYEVFTLTERPPPAGVGVVLIARLESPTVTEATVSRTRKPRGPQLGANLIGPGPDGKDQFKKSHGIPGKESTGKLRLVRTGTSLHHQAADGGGSFQTILVSDVGADEVKAVRIQCYTGWTKGILDVRVSNLEIQAGQIPDKPTGLSGGVAASPAAPPAPAKALRPGLATVLVLGLGGILSFLVVIGLWLRSRQRRGAGVPLPRADEPAPTAAALLSFVCSSCEKTVKAAVKLAGKKARCPRCGQVIRIPAPVSG
jgi:hypothetical protein